MFEEINNYKIIVRDLQDKGMHYIPNVISVHPLESLFLATEWLVTESLKDYKETHDRIEERRKLKGACQENIDEYDSLAIRLGSRTQSYVNQICLMEDILVFEYKRMIRLVNALLKKSKRLKEEDFRTLRKKMKSIRTFRNKVVAHTAYTFPQTDKKSGKILDNPETVVRSIINLFPQSGYITMGNNYYSGFSPYRSELPVISIFNWETEIKPVLFDWRNLFIDQLVSIFKLLPLENTKFRIEAANPSLFRNKLNI